MSDIYYSLLLFRFVFTGLAIVFASTAIDQGTGIGLVGGVMASCFSIWIASMHPDFGFDGQGALWLRWGWRWRYIARERIQVVQKGATTMLRIKGSPIVPGLGPVMFRVVAGRLIPGYRRLITRLSDYLRIPLPS